MSSATPTLFSPLKLGEIETKNRIFMAPLTRCRATAGTDAPNAMIAQYYAQRASAGLIVSEATQIEPRGKGYVNTPGIYSAEQEAGWRLVADSVHAKGGKIIAQLWHVGAVSHPDFQPGDLLPVSSSVYSTGGTTYTQHGKRDRVAARALETIEVQHLIGGYRHAAELAKRAGLDGIEIHSANGYLLEQFIRDSINKRTDAFGGNTENRLRFTLAAVDQAIAALGAGRVGIRLSPVTDSNGAPQDTNPNATYGALVEALARRKLAFVHFIEGNTGRSRDNIGQFDFAAAKRTLMRAGVAYVANNKYDREMALNAITTGAADAVAFGVPFIANPDLPARLQANAALNAPDTKTFYSEGAAGYTDYPTMEQN
jgi:N-ethylmaleimide reductase